jgi:hypothetical protein
MSDDTRVRALPRHPNLEHLKNEAKDRLALMRITAPEAQLAEAQFEIARAYGFSSWRALKEEVEKQTGSVDIDPHAPLSAVTGLYAGVIENFFTDVTQRDGGLLLKGVTGPEIFARRGEDGWFHADAPPQAYGFADVVDGKAQTVFIRSARRTDRATRIDAATADTMRLAYAAAREEQRRPRTAISVPPEVIERHVGHYAGRHPVALEISRDGNQLYCQLTGMPRFLFNAESETLFFNAVISSQIEFRVEDGKTTGLVLHQGGMRMTMPRASAEEARDAGAEITRRAVEQQQPRTRVAVKPEILSRYAGRYRIGDRLILTVMAEEDRLFAEMPNQPRIEIFPESETKFFWTVRAAQLEFFLTPDGEVSHAVMHQVGQMIPLTRLGEEEAAA